MEETLQKIRKLIEGQQRSTNLWISQYERYKDVSGVRNAAFAIGKLAGMINTYMQLNQGELPEDLISLREHYTKIWDNLEVKE